MAKKWKDIQHKASPEVRERVHQEALAELERIGFNKLRQAREQTQVALAERLNIPQSGVSRLENQSDLLLSTLRKYVGALGGELQVRVVFPDAQFELERLGDTIDPAA